MAKVGIKCLTYAKYSEGGDGSSVTYTGGKQLKDYLCRAELTEARDSVKEHADDHQIDSDNTLNSVSLALELANSNDDIKKDFLGYTADTAQGSTDLIVTGDDAPYVGVGYMMKNRFKKTVTFDTVWCYKMQFSSAGVTAETRREQTQFQHETINGEGEGVIVEEDGKVCFYALHTGFASESLAEAWLKTKAGIT